VLKLKKKFRRRKVKRLIVAGNSGMH
jgi:hypothetical protein